MFGKKPPASYTHPLTHSTSTKNLCWINPDSNFVCRTLTYDLEMWKPVVYFGSSQQIVRPKAIYVKCSLEVKFIFLQQQVFFSFLTHRQLKHFLHSGWDRRHFQINYLLLHSGDIVHAAASELARRGYLAGSYSGQKKKLKVFFLI